MKIPQLLTPAGILLIALGLPGLGACSKNSTSAPASGSLDSAQVTDPRQSCTARFLEAYDRLLDQLAHHEKSAPLQSLREQVVAFRAQYGAVRCTRPQTSDTGSKKPEIIFVAQETERALSVIDASLALAGDGSEDDR